MASFALQTRPEFASELRWSAYPNLVTSSTFFFLNMQQHIFFLISSNATGDRINPLSPLKSLEEFCYQGVTDPRVRLLSQKNGLLQLLGSLGLPVTSSTLFFQLQQVQLFRYLSAVNDNEYLLCQFCLIKNTDICFSAEASLMT